MDIPYGRYQGAVMPPLLATMAFLGIDMSPITSHRRLHGPVPMLGSFALAPQVTGLLQSLHAERDRLRAEGKAILVLAETAGGFTDEQRARLDAINAETERIDADIARQQAADRLLIEAPVVSILDAVGPAAPTEAPKPFATFGEQMAAIRASTIGAKSGRAPDPRIVAIQDYARAQAAASGLNETVGADAGFAVQIDYSDRILSRIDEQSVLWPRAFPVPLSADSNGVKINLLDETSRATGSRWGGVQVYWEAEATTVTAKKPKIAPLELTLQKLMGIGYRTGEIGQDWTASGALMEAAFSAEMAFALDDAAIRGTGAGMPRGVLNASSLVSVSAEAGQAADTVITENIEKMFARMPASSKPDSIWVINGELWPQIFALGRAIGTGGVPMFIASGAIGAAPGGNLLGRPIVEMEQASAPGDVGDILFLDMGEYLRLDKGGVQRASSIHVEFLTDQEVFRWILRTNGAPAWLSAVTPYKGSLARSPFVALAAR